MSCTRARSAGSHGDSCSCLTTASTSVLRGTSPVQFLERKSPLTHPVYMHVNTGGRGCRLRHSNWKTGNLVEQCLPEAAASVLGLFLRSPSVAATWELAPSAPRHSSQSISRRGSKHYQTDTLDICGEKQIISTREQLPARSGAPRLVELPLATQAYAEAGGTPRAPSRSPCS